MRRAWRTAALASVLLLPQGGAAAQAPVWLAAPPPVASPAAPQRVSAAVAAPFAAAGLGKRVSVAVVDAASGQPLYRKDSGSPVLPASTLKLVTALTALTVLPPDATLNTRLVAGGPVTGGVLAGDLVLVGGGDATLSSLETPGYPSPSRLSALADAVRRKGIRSVTGGIVVDGSAYAGPVLAAGWKPTYVTEGSVAPVSALSVDGAHRPAGATRGSRSQTPALLTGQRLAALLKARGVVVAGGVSRGTAAADAAELGIVKSAPVAALVEKMLQRSDNDLAEALLRRAAVEKGLPASFEGGGEVAMATLRALGLPTAGVVVRDGSGLSRENRVTTDLLAAILRLAAADDRPQLRPLLSGLPVAGFNGTLQRRYRDTATKAAAGNVRAKTGTLNNVTTLAGMVMTEGGQLLMFAASADQVASVSVDGAARLLDKAVAAVEACGCP